MNSFAARRLPLARFAEVLEQPRLSNKVAQVPPLVAEIEPQPKLQVCSLCGLSEEMRSSCKTCAAIYMPPDRNRREYVKGKAHRAVARAVLTGALPPLGIRCVDCGAPATEWEHRDYSKPLDVVPVCRSCNCLRGAAACPA